MISYEADSNSKLILFNYIPGFLTALNCYNVKWVTRLQDVFSTAKVLALVCIVVVGFWALIQGQSLDSESIMEGTKYSPGEIALAFYSGMFSFAGWLVNYKLVSINTNLDFEEFPLLLILCSPM